MFRNSSRVVKLWSILKIFLMLYSNLFIIAKIKILKLKPGIFPAKSTYNIINSPFKPYFHIFERSGRRRIFFLYCRKVIEHFLEKNSTIIIIFMSLRLILPPFWPRGNLISHQLALKYSSLLPSTFIFNKYTNAIFWGYVYFRSHYSWRPLRYIVWILKIIVLINISDDDKLLITWHG